MGGVLKGEFDLGLAEDGGLIRSHEPDALCELAEPGSPTIEDAELERGDRNLGDADEAKHSDHDEIAAGLRPDVFTKDGELQIGEEA